MRAPVLTAGATLLATLFAAVLWLGSAGPAHAHAALVAVEPADGAVVARAPATFALTFSEPTSPLVLKLVRPDGTGTVLDRFTLRDSTLDIAAPGDLGPGTYVLSWRVVSEDGHPVGGSAVFSIGSPSLRDGAAPQEAADWPLLAAIWAARTVLYAGLFIGIGGVFFQSWIGDRNRFVASVLAATLVAGFVAAVLSVGLLGLDGLDLPLGSILTRPPWQTGAATRFGLTAVIAAAALAVALAVILAGAPAAPRV
ncbi:MAG: copper resistance protein CopC, partial [Rhizobiales bacterium]|nr:copper resistance protein CopC [Hyphomicrobiales bacterium]